VGAEAAAAVQPAATTVADLRETFTGSVVRVGARVEVVGGVTESLISPCAVGDEGTRTVLQFNKIPEFPNNDNGLKIRLYDRYDLEPFIGGSEKL
jgi:hypothetical protein